MAYCCPCDSAGQGQQCATPDRKQQRLGACDGTEWSNAVFRDYCGKLHNSSTGTADTQHVLVASKQELHLDTSLASISAATLATMGDHKAAAILNVQHRYLSSLR